MNTRASVRECAPKTQALFLVGFMGAGKSSVGELLGQRLGWPFEDLDMRIQQRDGRSIEQIFAESGEPFFRRVEHEALREVVSELGGKPRVIALGGGAFAQPENIQLLKRAGVATVFLDGSVDELFRRCQDQGRPRPLRSDLELFRKLYDARREHYLGASLRVDTSAKTIEAVAIEVVDALGL
ncbi:MAG TPA: shikimate kinase [Terriglobales bacterium]